MKLQVSTFESEPKSWYAVHPVICLACDWLQLAKGCLVFVYDNRAAPRLLVLNLVESNRSYRTPQV